MGIASVGGRVGGLLVCLGDMPQVRAGLIDKLLAAFDPERGALVVIQMGAPSDTRAPDEFYAVLNAATACLRSMGIEIDIGGRTQ